MRILLVGCGKMGGAMLAKWLEADSSVTVDVVNPSPLAGKFGAAAFADNNNVNHFTSVEQFASLSQGLPDIVVLAVKPQIANDVCTEMAKKLYLKDVPVLSIMTGKTVETLKSYFTHNPIIRAMPNTPSQIGKGVTVAIATNVNTVNVANQLLSANGKVHWVTDESLINVVAAVSGSGPAYFDLFAQTLAEAGIENGLPRDLAYSLARETLIGAGALAEATPDKTLEDLRLQVTSPGGSTAKAVESYQANDNLLNVQRSAVKAAIKRNIELGK